jgi:hypothetical protein
MPTAPFKDCTGKHYRNAGKQLTISNQAVLPRMNNHLSIAILYTWTQGE